MTRRRLRHAFEYIAFRVIVCLIEALSPRSADRLAGRIAFVIDRWLPVRWNRNDVARVNMQIAFRGELTDRQLDRLVSRMWVNLVRTVIEVLQFRRRLSRDTFNDLVCFRNREAMVSVLCSNRPVILVSGHFGNWELAVWVLGLFGFPLGVVARRLDNPHLDRFFDRFRRATGHELIDKRGAAGSMIDRLESNGQLAVLADQDAGPRGLFVDFLGHPASTFKSIALLALRYNAVICVGYARRLPASDNGPRFEMGCEELIDAASLDSDDPIRELTQRYTLALERVVRRDPDQYFWVHRRWKSRPGHRRARRRRAA